ncbi:MAG: hypothetical protein LBU32_26350 [Clostridiales bacterium]|nr:hypothetical protein [Clostridiales bacterium]
MKNGENRAAAGCGSLQPAEIKKAAPALPAMGRILLKSSVKRLMKKTGYTCKKYPAQILGFLGATMLSPLSHSTLFKYKLRQANNEKRAECIKKSSLGPLNRDRFGICRAYVKALNCPVSALMTTKLGNILQTIFHSLTAFRLHCEALLENM